MSTMVHVSCSAMLGERWRAERRDGAPARMRGNAMIVTFTTPWRANADWGAKLGHEASELNTPMVWPGKLPTETFAEITRDKVKIRRLRRQDIVHLPAETAEIPTPRVKRHWPRKAALCGLRDR